MQETFWLTYWVSFMILFVSMDYLENFIGFIPGFFSLCAAAVLYLMLPMFQGATVVFRRVLVPITGQYDNLLLYDTLVVRRAMEQSLPPGARRNQVMQRAADLLLGKTKEESKKD